MINMALLLYTEKQLHRAYKVYIERHVTPGSIGPTLEQFREWFESSPQLQELADETVREH